MRLLLILFTTLTIASALAMPPSEFLAAVLAYNSELRNATEQIGIAKENLTIAESRIKPQLSGRINRNLTKRNSDQRNRTQYSATLTQTLFNLNKALSIEQAELLLKAAELQFKTMEQQIMLNAYQVYLAASLAKANLKALEQRRRTVERQLLVTKNNFELGRGEATLVDELSVRAQLAQIDAQQVEARRAMEAASLRLEQLAGNNAPEQTLSLVSSIPSFEGSVNYWAQEVEAKSPQVKSSLALLEAERKAVKVTRSIIFPNASLKASTNLRGEETIAISVEVPLFSSGGATAALRKAYAGVRIAENNLIQIKRDVNINSQEQFLRYQYENKRTELLEATVKAQQLRLEAATELSESGEGVVTEVLAAASEAANAKVSVIDSKHSQILALLNLKASVGELSLETVTKYDNLFSN